VIAETSAEFPNVGSVLEKLQQNFGQPIDYFRFKSIVNGFEHNEEATNKLIEALFTKGYLVGIDVKGKEIFSDIQKLRDKINARSIPIIGRIFKKKIYNSCTPLKFR
jgi:hypothetical protein